jgi:hypothetical protein
MHTLQNKRDQDNEMKFRSITAPKKGVIEIVYLDDDSLFMLTSFKTILFSVVFLIGTSLI